MSLIDLYERNSSCVVAFINKLQRLPLGQAPIFPEIIGTGFLANSDGVVVTNRHVVDCLGKLGTRPLTGEFNGAALLMLVDKEHKGCQLLSVSILRWGAVDTFSSTDQWYGQTVPDVGFVQIGARETPFLELATEDFAIRPGMEISTIGFPMGTVALTLNGKIGQVSPFIRRGIISSVNPFPVPQPHGFTIDIMQQGGSSGSPIFGPDGHRVVGIMWGGVNDTRIAESETASLCYTIPTNISLAEPSHIISAALIELLRDNSPLGDEIPTLQELSDQYPMPLKSTGLTWDHVQSK